MRAAGGYFLLLMDLPDARIPGSVDEHLPTASSLLNCEVAMYMDRLAAGEEKFPESFGSLLEYVRKTNKFKSQSAVDEALNIVDASGLPHFARASLVNLMPETVEEARALIPDLDSLPDDDLSHILTNLKNTQNFVTN